MIMKNIILITVLFFTISNTKGQSKFIRSFKIVPYGEIMYAPISITEIETRTIYSGTFVSNARDTMINHYDRPVSFSFVSLIYTLRGNIYEMNGDRAFGINFSPSFGLSISDYGSLSMNLPLYLTYNFGVGSTLSSEKNSGGYVGLGYEFNRINLSDYVVLDWSFGFSSRIIEEVEPQNSWIQPMAIAGYRWRAKKGKTWEVAFKYGWSSDSKDIPSAVKKDIGSRPQTFQASIGWVFE